MHCLTMEMERASVGTYKDLLFYEVHLFSFLSFKDHDEYVMNGEDKDKRSWQIQCGGGDYQWYHANATCKLRITQ